MTEKFTKLTLENYLKELSSEKPVPGGGSCSAYVAALGMGLVQMVASISAGRKKKAGLTPEQEKEDNENRATLSKIREALEKTKKEALEIVDLDPKVYQEVMDAWGKEDRMEDALHNSFRLQADLALLIVMAREWNQSLAGIVKGSIKNDLIVSAALLDAAFKGAYHTAMINVVYMKNEEKKAKAEKALQELKEKFEKGSHVGQPG